MNKKCNYIVALITAKKKYWLLWQEVPGKKDQFVCDPQTKTLLINDSMKALLSRAGKLGLNVEETGPTSYDIDLIFRKLRNLRPNRRCKTETCNVLLDGWNIIDDMARSVNVKLTALAREEKKSIDKIYDKLYFGNNLPAVTPQDKKFSPSFTSEELKLIRNYLRRVWMSVHGTLAK